MNHEFHVTHASHKSNFIHSLSQCFKISDPNIRVLVNWIQLAIGKDFVQFEKGWSNDGLKIWMEAIPCKPTVSFRKVFRVTSIDHNLSSSSIGVNRQKVVLICKHIWIAKFLNNFIMNWWTMLILLEMVWIGTLSTPTVLLSPTCILVCFHRPRTLQINSSSHSSCLKTQ